MGGSMKKAVFSFLRNAAHYMEYLKENKINHPTKPPRIPWVSDSVHLAFCNRREDSETRDSFPSLLCALRRQKLVFTRNRYQR